jgi:hypothetical protein
MTTINRFKFLLTCALVALVVTAPLFWLLKGVPPAVLWTVCGFVYVLVFTVMMAVWGACFVSSDVDRRMGR